MLDEALGGVPRGTSGDLESQVAELERLAKENQLAEYSPGVVGVAERFLQKPYTQRILDVLSRGNYAAAGAVDALASGQGPLGAAARAVTEVGSGIGSLKGKKERFAEVFEKRGMPSLGQVSDILPMQSPERAKETVKTLSMFDPSGITAALAGTWRVGGPLDITGRGTLGLGADIVLDPMTYLGGGAAKEVLTEGGAKVALSRAGEAAVGREIVAAAPALVAGEKVAVEALPSLSEDAAKKAAQIVGARRVEEAMRPAEGATLAERVPAAKKIAEERAMPSPEFKAAVDDQARTILAAGFEKGSSEYQVFRDLVQKEAEDRVLYAAKTFPQLLDPGGVKWAGLTLPGTPATMTALSKGAQKAISGLESAPVISTAVGWSKKGYDIADKLFHRDAAALRENLPAYIATKQAHLDNEAMRFGDVAKQIESSPGIRWYLGLTPKYRASIGRDVIRQIEAGAAPAGGKFTPQIRQLTGEMRQILDDMAAKEVESGELQGVRPNYVPHFYNNTESEMSQVFPASQPFVVFRGKNFDLSSLGAHGEERVFDTIDQAEAVAKMLAKPKSPQLKPVTDLGEILMRRAQAHARTMSYGDFYRTLRDQWGIPWNPSMAHDLTPPEVGKMTAAQTRDYLKVQDWAATGNPTLKEVQSLPSEMQAEFMRQKMLRVQTKPEYEAVVEKYGDLVKTLPPSRTGTPADAFGAPMVPVRVSPTLENVFLPREIADDLGDMSARVADSGAMQSVVNGWNRANNFFKSYVTVAFPSFHVRNAYSNIAQSLLDIGVNALDPRKHAEAMQILRGGEGEFVAKNGLRYSYDEIRKLMAENRIVVTGADVAELTGKRSTYTGGIGRVMRDVAAKVENEARAQLFLDHLRRGLSVNQAAERTKMFLFDYQNLSRFEKNKIRSWIPFYTWTRKNLGLQVESLAKRPGRVLAEQKPFMGRESEDEKMVSWEGEAMKLRLNRDGKTIRVLSGVDLPFKSLDLLPFSGGIGKSLARWAGMFTPYAKVPFELAAGSQFFTRKPFERRQADLLGSILVKNPQLKSLFRVNGKPDAAGRMHYTMDEERFYLVFQSWIFSRLVSTSEREFRSFANDKNMAAAALDVLTGLKAKDINLDEQQQKKLRERQAYLEDLLYKANVLQRFQKTYQQRGQ